MRPARRVDHDRLAAVGAVRAALRVAKSSDNGCGLASLARMSEHVGIRFMIGGLFPADDPVARWTTVCAMALNDLLLVNRWLLPNLENDGPEYATAYLGRLGSSHLHEIANFLDESERRFPAVKNFVVDLDERDRAAYERVKAASPLRATEPFASQLKRSRDLFFHYVELLPHEPDFEELKVAMDEHADTSGEIIDTVGEFRARFADDLPIEMSFPEESVDLDEYISALSARISDFLTFAVAALGRYTELAPPEDWEYVSADEGPTPRGRWHYWWQQGRASTRHTAVQTPGSLDCERLPGA